MSAIKIREKSKYKTVLSIAAWVIPPVMGALGYFYGDVRPVIVDFCSLVQDAVR